MRFWLVRWAVLGVAIASTAWLLPGVEIDGGVMTTLAIAAVFARAPLTRPRTAGNLRRG